MTNDYSGKDRRKTVIDDNERAWLVSLLDGFNDKVDHLLLENRESRSEFSRRLSVLEEAINGTTKEPGLSESDRSLKKEVSFIKKIVYWAAGTLAGAQFLQLFIKGHE